MGTRNTKRRECWACGADRAHVRTSKHTQPIGWALAVVGLVLAVTVNGWLFLLLVVGMFCNYTRFRCSKCGDEWTA